ADLALLLQPVEQRIDAALGELEPAGGAHFLEQLEPIALPALERRQHGELRGALPELCLPRVEIHRATGYTVSCIASNPGQTSPGRPGFQSWRRGRPPPGCRRCKSDLTTEDTEDTEKGS